MTTAAPTVGRTPQPLIALTGVDVGEAGRQRLQAIDLTLVSGEIITLIGPNGAGKSTLVKTALGLITPDRGAVVIRPGLRIGYVPQTVDIDHTLPLSVIRFLQLVAAANDHSIAAVLQEMGIGALRNAPMNAISGGEMRRVLLARALLKHPQLLILDEPAAGIDISGQAALYTLIQTLRDRYNCGILLVSHDLHVVMSATDRVICLNRHICCSGTPSQVRQHPQYASLFDRRVNDQLAIYRHHHNHAHSLDGTVDPRPDD